MHSKCVHSARYLIYNSKTNFVIENNTNNQLQEIPWLWYDASIMTTVLVIVHLTTSSTLSLPSVSCSMPLADA